MAWRRIGGKPLPELMLTQFTDAIVYASVNWINIGSDNGLAPNRHQAIIQTNAGLLDPN